MFKHILLCTLLAHTMWAKPVHQHTGELAPHVLIVTPQAQLSLETLIPGTPIIEHLSPFTRFVAPHEETIVYVPASAAAAAPIQPYQYAEIVARSLPSNEARQDITQINNQIQQAIQTATQNVGSLLAGSFAPGDLNPTTALQAAISNVPSALGSAATAATAAAASAGSSFVSGASSFAPGGDWTSSLGTIIQGAIDNGPNALGSAASAASAAAASAGSSFASGITQTAPLSSSGSQSLLSSPSLLSSSLSSSLEPSPLPAPLLSSLPSLPSNKLPTSLPKIEKIEYEIPITPIVLNEPHLHYVIAPAAPHIVDFVKGPILLAPALSDIKARNLKTDYKENPIIAISLPEVLKPEALPLTTVLNKEELLKEINKKNEFKRFLEANALKDELKKDTLNLSDQTKTEEIPKIGTVDLEKTELELKSVPIADNEKDEKPQSKVA